MRVTIYLYAKMAPAARDRLFRCIDCQRGLFKYNSDQVLVANVIGGQEVYSPGSKWIEIQCHSCKSEHKILFQ